MRCVSCDRDNPEDAAFCGECGTSLVTAAACSSCGRCNAPGIRFCHGCGSRVLQSSGALKAERPEAAGDEAAMVAQQPLVHGRLALLELELRALRQQVTSLAVLKDNLDRAFEGLRRRNAASDERERRMAVAQARHAAISQSRGQPGITPSTTPGAGANATASAAALNGSAARVEQADGVTVVHVEEHASLQQVVQATVGKFGSARYVLAQELNGHARTGRHLLAINLLLESADPLAAVAGCEKWGIEMPVAVTYCTDAERGVVLGMVDFFPPPFEPDRCASRLLDRRGAAQRLLVVSDAVDASTELRSILARLGCATSVAFDARQALDLMPMVRPDVVLVDLNLPRGEGLRVVSRVRSNPQNSEVAFALMWREAIDAGEFREHALRAVRDLRFSDGELRRAMSRALSPTPVSSGAFERKAG